MPSDLDGKGYYRCLFPGRELARRGHTVRWAPHNKTAAGGHILLRYEFVDPRSGVVSPLDRVLAALDFDVLLMPQRGEPGIPEMARTLRSQGKRVVVDCDDDWLHVPTWNPGSRKPRAEVDQMLRLLEAADGLTVSTPALAETYREFNENVTVIRNTLDWRMWADVEPVYESRSWDRVRVGWMGELHWRRGDLELLRDFVGPWLRRHPEVEFVAAGDPTVHDFLSVPKDQRVSVQRTQFWWFDLPDITATMDVGLVPLAKCRLNEGKSHLKGLEYAACGIPCVASPSESYRWWVDEGVNGFVAGSMREWWDALDRLLDEGTRARMGAAARAKAAANTIQETANDWEAVLVGDREDAGGRVGAGVDDELAATDGRRDDRVAA